MAGARSGKDPVVPTPLLNTMSLTGSVRSSAIPAFASILFLLIFWLTLAPTQLGGWVTYVIVDGISMEPGFVLGDLVLVRTSPDYKAGDAVVYKDEELHSYVFHRIVGTDLDHYILQGDNNGWLDSYRPTRAEIVGKLWLRVPKAGHMIEWMRTPLNLSLAVGLAGGVFMFDLMGKPRRKKREVPQLNFGGGHWAAFISFGFLFFVFLGFGIFSFTRPSTRPAENISYQQDGMYYYSATGTPGVYDTDVVRSGEPVFPKLTCFLNIGYTYNLVGNGFQGASGTYKMSARILDEQSGWQRTIPLNGDTPFTGNSFFTLATLDLCQVESLVKLVEQQAGVKQVMYTLEIVTNVSLAASVEGNLVSDSFSQTLNFQYDKVQFYLAADESGIDPLHVTKPGMAGSTSVETNTISLLGFEVSILVLRVTCLAGIGISILGSTMLGAELYRAASRSREMLIRFKYGPLLVDVMEQNLPSMPAIIDVSSADDLARLAERHGTMILHTAKNFLHFYFVQIHGTTYRYVFSAGRKGLVEVDQPPAESDAPLKVFHPPTGPIHPEPVQTFTPAPEPLNEVIYSHPASDGIEEPEYQEVVQEGVEYVIKTGEIEFVMPRQETVILGRVRI